MDVLMEINLYTYEKCGEVLTSLNTDIRLYALKCLFCEERFTTLADFADHIEGIHYLTTKTAKDLLETDRNINSVYIEPKEEFLNEDLNDRHTSLDPLTDTLNTSEKKGDDEESLSQNENNIKAETDNDWSDDINELNENNTEISDGSEIGDDGESRYSYFDGELDANQDVTLALIDGLENLPVLWKKSSSQPQARKKREKALRNLTKNLNKRFGKRMKWTGIDERIKKLKKRFRNELINAEISTSEGETFQPSWYFSKLEFLKSSINLKERKAKNVKKTTIITEVPFNDEQHLKFIRIYESFPCLWNIEDVGFKSKTRRDIAMNQMAAAIKETIQLQLTEDEIQRKIKRLRSAYTTEKHELFNCERLGKLHEPKFKYFLSIPFLMENVCPFKCSHCSKTFKGREMFRVHKAQHDGTSPFTCSICKKSYSSPSHLAIHLRIHNGDYMYECKPCSKKFATTDEYNIHMRQHTGEKPFFCEICGKSFATWSLFGRHKRRHEKRPSHLCAICNRGFYEQSRYKEHMNAHNNVRDRVCDVCGKGFTHLKYLKQHKLIHTGRRDYVCTICGKDFAQKAGLYWHMKTHGAKVGDKVQTDEKGNKKATTKQKINLT